PPRRHVAVDLPRGGPVPPLQLAVDDAPLDALVAGVAGHGVGLGVDEQSHARVDPVAGIIRPRLSGEARVVQHVARADLLVELLYGEAGLVVAPAAIALPVDGSLYAGEDGPEDDQDDAEDRHAHDELHQGESTLGAEPAAQGTEHARHRPGR